MNIGKACAIFEQIDSDKYTDAEKLEAVREVVEMPTHNGITKAMMLTVLRWFAENTEPATEQPAADVAPVVHGTWMLDMDYEYLTCSVCGREMYTACNSSHEARILQKHWKPFCPHCGAKMDGGTHENYSNT